MLVALAILVSGFIVVGLPFARAAPQHVQVSAHNLNVTGVSYSFTPDLVNNLSMSTNYFVNFTDSDTAGAAHTFTILGWEGVVIPSSWGATQLSGLAYGRAHPYIANINASGAGTYAGNFTSPASPGWYEFVCTEGGHFQLGMFGFISFGEALPANLTVTAPATGAGLAVFIIVGTIVTLTVIAIVLGFVVGRREGAQFEMPPERLGYPEPHRPVEPPLASVGAPPKS